MNITFLSLISSSLFMQSPFLIKNRLSLINCYFAKSTSLLFLNQENLILKKSIFNQIYGSIIYNSYENNRQNNQRSYNKVTFNNDNKFTLGDISEKQSISIIECVFTDIHDTTSNIIQINSGLISLYITDTLFYDCQSSNGVIRLPNCRCLTITHTCSCKSSCQSDSCFLYFNDQSNDFSIMLYSSIVESKQIGSGEKNKIYTVTFDSTDQYFKCNNMTESPFGGIQFNNDQCLSIVMSTISCDYGCIYFSGGTNENDNTIKELEMTNLYNRNPDSWSENACIRFGRKCRLQLIIKNSIIISEQSLFYQTEPNVKITLEDCTFDSNKINTPQLIKTEINCNHVNNINTNNFISYPHFTYKTQCPGVRSNENEYSALGCNVGNCITNNCGGTIGFPDDVVPYTSVFHGDIQTKTLPSSKQFSKSFYFTYSNYFSDSKQFSKSSYFTYTNDFSDSRQFSKSFYFTYSNYFSDSKQFSKSSYFSYTNDFSDSKKFSKSQNFSPSYYFSDSDYFSERLKYFLSKSQSDDANSFQQTSYEIDDSISEDFNQSDQPGSNLGNDEKNNNGKMIGIIFGVVTAVAVISIVTTIVILKKRNRVNSLSEGYMISEEVSAVTVDNTLQDEMDNDDPFADDFK